MQIILSFLRFLCYPLSILYGIIIFFRHLLYDNKVFSSKKYNFPVICIGNVSVGGTGKTPMTEFLIQFLKDFYKIGIVSRGYKRTTKGVRLAKQGDTAQSIGDEPSQYFRKYSSIPLVVAENRQEGISYLRENNLDNQLILLDDAYQHRAVTPSYSIVLTAYYQLFTKDFLLPTGSLRDLKTRVSKADSIIVTKCPSDLSSEEMQCIKEEIQAYTDRNVYFTGIRYSSQVFSSVETKTLTDFIQEEFTLVVGIAEPTPLIEYLQQFTKNFQVMKFPDHHTFTKAQLAEIKQRGRILTTEKDFVRLCDDIPTAFYVPIQPFFINKDDEITFKSHLKVHIDSYF